MYQVIPLNSSMANVLLLENDLLISPAMLPDMQFIVRSVARQSVRLSQWQGVEIGADIPAIEVSYRALASMWVFHNSITPVAMVFEQ